MRDQDIPSTADAERTGRRPGLPASVREFLSALRDPSTYNPRRNLYVLFGFLWGLPIPVVSVTIDCLMHAPLPQPACILEHLSEPIQIFFLLQPFIFAVVFGAMGTVRHNKNRQIKQLLSELQRHVVELAHANEQLQELDALKAQFIANVTHELKTPLVSIRGYTEAIMEERMGPLAPKQREGLAVAIRNIDRLHRLIDELLEFERLDSGELKLQPSDFDLVPLVRSSLDTLRPQIDRKRLPVKLGLPAQAIVHADREKIGRVLQNLLSNAVKFTSEGTTIGVDVSADPKSGRALVSVWDRGPGIPASAQKYLFHRFWQAEGAARGRPGGTGLGLAICKGILDAHGSTIQVVSSEGAGTTVLFDLPLSREPAHDRQAAHPDR